MPGGKPSVVFGMLLQNLPVIARKLWEAGNKIGWVFHIKTDNEQEGHSAYSKGSSQHEIGGGCIGKNLLQLKYYTVSIHTVTFRSGAMINQRPPLYGFQVYNFSNIFLNEVSFKILFLSSLIFNLSCSVVSRYLMVTVSSSKVWWSTAMQNGVPIRS